MTFTPQPLDFAAIVERLRSSREYTIRLDEGEREMVKPLHHEQRRFKSDGVVANWRADVYVTSDHPTVVERVNGLVALLGDPSARENKDKRNPRLRYDYINEALGRNERTYVHVDIHDI